MKMNRIITVLVLALLMALCMVLLTACGSDPITVGNNPGAHEHTETPDVDTPGDNDTPTPGSVCLHKSYKVEGKKSATCLAEGYTGDKVCSDCGKVLEAGSVTPTGACNFEDTEILFEPDCEMIGVKLCTCTVCLTERNESIPALGHDIAYEDALEDLVNQVSHDDFHTESCRREDCDYSVQVKHGGRLFDQDATCAEYGYSYATCPTCRVTYRIYDESKIPTGHSFGEWVLTTAPTCQTEGEETRTCSKAGCIETRSVDIDPEAHEWVLDTENPDYVAATCQNAGNDTFKCAHENCVATKQEATDQLEHNWSEGVENGDVIDYECLNENCEATKQEPVTAPEETPEA